MLCGCRGCISGWLLSHIAAYCCRVRKQVPGTNGNHDHHTSQGIRRYRCEQYVTRAPVVLSTCSNLRPLRGVTIPIINMSRSLCGELQRQEAGRRWQRKCDGEVGCRGEGGWKSVESDSYHIWEGLHTPVRGKALALCRAQHSTAFSQ